jgi:hypothetical protein
MGGILPHNNIMRSERIPGIDVHYSLEPETEKA